MSTIRKSITFTTKLSDWIQSLIVGGEYANESEYIRDLVRRDREKNQGLQQLRAEIQTGLDSGISSKSVNDIMSAVEDKLDKGGRL
jgi:antitoxin ParD1/3/4